MSQVKRPELVVFAGPSLSHDAVRALAKKARVACEVRGPARQGDLWRVLVSAPVAIALIDGVFEAPPPVWHHEILAAMQAGVTVFGAASMGALRAAELHSRGMIGVGRIFEGYRDGALVDDAEVALLFAGEEHGWRPATVPLVNVRHAAARAQTARILDEGEARTLIDVAAGVFYQDRTWARILEAAGADWSGQTRDAWAKWAPGNLEDLKRLDAEECLRVAADHVRARRRSPPQYPAMPESPPAPVRSRRLLEGACIRSDGEVLEARGILEGLQRAEGADGLASAGLKRALLAGWARSLGLSASPEELAGIEKAWRQRLGLNSSARWLGFLAASGLDRGQARRLCEDLVLEQRMLRYAGRVLNDGPSWLEALADEARLQGTWAERVEDRGKRAPAKKRKRG